MITKRTINSVTLHVAADYEELNSYAANVMAEGMKKKPTASILASTGTSQLGMYKRLIADYTPLFSRAVIFNMYEYCQKTADGFTFIPEDSSQSFKRYMRVNFLEHIPVAEHYFPTLENVSKEGTYDAFIEQKGGIDMAIATIGEDGHTFGFNLPGTASTSQTRLVTIDAFNKGVINTLTDTQTPDYAITTGIGTGMHSRQIIFLASGKRKAEIFKKILLSPVTEQIPATILRIHPNCVWIVDEAILSALS